MAKEQQEILGKNWTKEVGSWKVKENIRNEFYQKAAGLKFEVDTDLNKLLKDPKSEGLKTQEELNKEKEFKYRVKEGKNERLYNILDKYFKEIGIEPNNREKETALSLYCLTQQGVNVDLIVPSWKVEIKEGKLYIKKSTGEFAVEGVSLRTIKGVTDKQEQTLEDQGDWKDWSLPAGLPPGYPEKSPEEKTKDGWTKLPPIPGYKAPAEKSEPPAPKPKPKPKKTKTESKPSDFLEKI